MSLPIENVQDYPRPPALEPVHQRLTVEFEGAVVAETTAAFRVLETHHAPTYYFPPDDVTGTLIAVAGATFCEWKGKARYFDLIVDGKAARRAVWSFDAPTEGFRPIAGYLAFYSGLMDACYVADEPVKPQPGDFYGGWVTSNLTGIPKGARGTEHW